MRGIDWTGFPLKTLQGVVECIGGDGLACVCSHLAEDYSAWMGGMPDLLLWHPGMAMGTIIVEYLMEV